MSKPTRPVRVYDDDHRPLYMVAETDAYIDRIEADNAQLRTERDSWKGMYILCNEREQKLSKIKELAGKFIRAYDDSHCWIENGVEEVSVYLDELTAALTQREGGEATDEQ